MYQADIEAFSLGDLLRPDVLADPYPFFRRLRLEDPVHEDSDGRGWMVSRYEDVSSVLADRRFSAERVLNKQNGEGAPNAVQAALARQMLFLDPPDHTRLRSLVYQGVYAIPCGSVAAAGRRNGNAAAGPCGRGWSSNRLHPGLRGPAPGCSDSADVGGAD